MWTFSAWMAARARAGWGARWRRRAASTDTLRDPVPGGSTSGAPILLTPRCFSGARTRAPIQARNGWRPSGRRLGQPAAPSKDYRIFVQTMGSTSSFSIVPPFSRYAGIREPEFESRLGSNC